MYENVFFAPLELKGVGLFFLNLVLTFLRITLYLATSWWVGGRVSPEILVFGAPRNTFGKLSFFFSIW